MPCVLQTEGGSEFPARTSFLNKIQFSVRPQVSWLKISFHLGREAEAPVKEKPYLTKAELIDKNQETDSRQLRAQGMSECRVGGWKCVIATKRKCQNLL